MANLVLEHGGELPPFWRELGAAVISPPTGFNRLAFGERFRPVSSRAAMPAYYSRLQLGFSGTAQNDAGHVDHAALKRNEALVDFSIDYGLPGKPGYAYRRPFDYFTFQATASSANGFENVLTRGLLVGDDYEVGPRLSRRLGPLRQLRLHRAADLPRLEHRAFARHDRRVAAVDDLVALQGTLLAGVGYAAVGHRHGHRRHRLPLRRSRRRRCSRCA